MYVAIETLSNDFHSKFGRKRLHTAGDMIKWSASVLGVKHGGSSVKLRPLFPPFLQKESKDERKGEEISSEAAEIDFVRRTRRKVTATVGVSEIKYTEGECSDTEDLNIQTGNRLSQRQMQNALFKMSAGIRLLNIFI